MRENIIPRTTHELEQIVTDALAADPSRPINITINAPDAQVADNGGVNKRHAHPAWTIGLATVIAMGIHLNAPVDTAQAADFSATVKQVAQCEGISSSAVHNQMKNKYTYNKYTEMTKLDYYLGKMTLNSRKCNAN